MLFRAILLPVFLVVLYYSLTKIAEWAPAYHIGFDPNRPATAAGVFILSVTIGGIFYYARFNFGYLVGFYLFASMAAFFWINAFNELAYDHSVALASSVASVVLFLAAALFVAVPLPTLPLKSIAFDRLPDAILCFSFLVLIVAFADGFHLVGLSDMYKFRAEIVHARLLNYAIGNVTVALIPLAFACYLEQRRWVSIALLVTVSMLFYPVTLTKISFLAAPFLIFVAVVSSRLCARAATMLSLLLPLIIGAAAVWRMDWNDLGEPRLIVFMTTCLRLFAIPANSLEHYFEFFTTHPLTYFCQISVIKYFSSCPYNDQLGVVFAERYGLGNMNASLFATEGIASVGPIWAPISALVCGLVISVGNSVTKGLPQRFVLISGSISAITLLSVPLSVTLLSYGMGLLFLIWYAMPRPMADKREQMSFALRIRRIAALPVYTVALVLSFVSDLLGYLGAVIADDPR